jgi:hypothetical protein
VSQQIACCVNILTMFTMFTNFWPRLYIEWSYLLDTLVQQIVQSNQHIEPIYIHNTKISFLITKRASLPSFSECDSANFQYLTSVSPSVRFSLNSAGLWLEASTIECFNGLTDFFWGFYLRTADTTGSSTDSTITGLSSANWLLAFNYFTLTESGLTLLTCSLV